MTCYPICCSTYCNSCPEGCCSCNCCCCCPEVEEMSFSKLADYLVMLAKANGVDIYADNRKGHLPDYSSLKKKGRRKNGSKKNKTNQFIPNDTEDVADGEIEGTRPEQRYTGSVGGPPRSSAVGSFGGRQGPGGSVVGGAPRRSGPFGSFGGTQGPGGGFNGAPRQSNAYGSIAGGQGPGSGPRRSGALGSSIGGGPGGGPRGFGSVAGGQIYAGSIGAASAGALGPFMGGQGPGGGFARGPGGQIYNGPGGGAPGGALGPFMGGQGPSEGFAKGPGGQIYNGTSASAPSGALGHFPGGGFGGAPIGGFVGGQVYDGMSEVAPRPQSALGTFAGGQIFDGQGGGLVGAPGNIRGGGYGAGGFGNISEQGAVGRIKSCICTPQKFQSNGQKQPGVPVCVCGSGRTSFASYSQSNIPVFREQIYPQTYQQKSYYNQCNSRLCSCKKNNVDPEKKNSINMCISCP